MLRPPLMLTLAQQTWPVMQVVESMHPRLMSASPRALPLDDAVPPDDDDDEVPPASLLVDAGDDELLQPDASARPMDPTLSVVTKRIFELCMGNVPPPE
jgi:hypothetical protein